MSKLTVMVVGAEHTKGLAKKDDRPYDFASVSYLKQAQGWSNDKGASTVVGLEVAKIDMDNTNPSLMNAFREIASALPCTLELTLALNPNNPQRNWVSDIKVVS